MPFPTATSESYVTFHEGGTLSESGSSAAFQPGQRSSGHGAWERTSRDTYSMYFQAFVQFTSVVTPPAVPRHTRGWMRLEHDIEMMDRDHWTSDGTTTFFDAAGAVIPPSGCATAVATRLP